MDNGIDVTKKDGDKYPSVFDGEYEIIYKLLDPPDNVEVVTSENLIKFAQRIVLAYARNLPKKVDEIVYDVRTAKYYLEQTGKFEVIDQNNYDNPFYTMDDDDAKIKIGNGSLIGTDDYAWDKRLHTKPSQTVIITSLQEAIESVHRISFM